MATDPKIRPPSYALLKWLFGSVLGLLFIVGVIAQLQQTEDATKEGRTQMLDLDQPSNNSAGESLEEKRRRAMELMASSNEADRMAGMEAILILDVATGGPLVHGMMNDASPAVRVQAMKLLQGYNVKGSGQFLVDHLIDRDPSARAMALQAFPSFAAEPGVAPRLATSLLSPDPAVQVGALEAWRTVFPHDRNGSIQVIQTVLGSNNEDAIVTVLSFLQPQLNDAEKLTMRGILSGVQSRFPGQPAGAAASGILSTMPGASS